jgi:crotonobetainyl-CoA:carnitine CoA-transferase CaiB-like acyl-CoA transferase
VPCAPNDTYETKDGLLMLVAANPRQERRLWRLLGREDVLDPTLTPDERYRRQVDLLEEAMPTRTADEWEQLLQEHGVPAARVRTLSEALLDPHVQSRHVFAEQRAEGVSEAFLVPVAPFEFAHGGPRVATPPPTVGQHTAEILGELNGSRTQGGATDPQSGVRER